MVGLTSTPIDSPAAWRGQDLARAQEWTITLDKRQVQELDEALEHAMASGRSLFRLRRAEFPLSSLGPVLDGVRGTLVDGRGFVRLRGLPVARWGEEGTRHALWGLGTHLGWAEPQDGAGNLLHDVRDVGRKFGADDNIRYFQTNQAIDFHNDGADIFALCCLRKGMTGGLSRMVSAVEVFNEMLRRRPDLAKVLQQDFHVDARGQRGDGERCQVLPVYTVWQGHLTILLKLAYVYPAQRFDDVPRLSPAQVEALELLVALMEEEGMALEFELEPGDVLIGSNHLTLHGRTAFTDTGDGGQRHMLRLWLSIENGPPLPPHYANTREFAATYARRMPATGRRAETDV